MARQTGGESSCFPDEILAIIIIFITLVSQEVNSAAWICGFPAIFDRLSERICGDFGRGPYLSLSPLFSLLISSYLSLSLSLTFSLSLPPSPSLSLLISLFMSFSLSHSLPPLQCEPPYLLFLLLSSMSFSLALALLPLQCQPLDLLILLLSPSRRTRPAERSKSLRAGTGVTSGECLCLLRNPQRTSELQNLGVLCSYLVHHK